jgi:hypothetical protein
MEGDVQIDAIDLAAEGRLVLETHVQHEQMLMVGMAHFMRMRRHTGQY